MSKNARTERFDVFSFSDRFLCMCLGCTHTQHILFVRSLSLTLLIPHFLTKCLFFSSPCSASADCICESDLTRGKRAELTFQLGPCRVYLFWNNTVRSDSKICIYRHGMRPRGESTTSTWFVILRPPSPLALGSARVLQMWWRLILSARGNLFL